MQGMTEEMRDDMRQRLLRLVELSLEELEDHFMKGTDGRLCARIALHILKTVGSGALAAPATASDDAKQV